MHFLKLLHFAALLVWCGTLLYLPALIAAGTRPSQPVFYRDHAQVMRMVFTLVSSPAALVAIASGTALFLGAAALDAWLILKLSAVALLVIGHALCGVLILKLEGQPEGRVRGWCVVLGGSMALLMGAALWLVLGKPPMPWSLS